MSAPLVRKFVFFTDADVERFMAFMRANRKPMAEQKRFLQVTVAEYKSNRSNEQNAYMWAGILEPMEQQAMIAGARFKADIWNELGKELFLPDVNAKGQEKWQYLPNGSRRLMMSTSDLNHEEMTLYLHALAAYAVDELGVLLPANPRDL
jgi:hypothetical protein